MSYPERTPAWRRYLGLIRPPLARDVDDELRFHLQSRIEDLIARGCAPGDARRQAEEEFGDVGETRGDLVAIGRRVAARRHRGEWTREALADARYAVRSLRRTPGVALAIVTLLALGVGANAGMFTFIDSVFIRMPAGVARPDGIRRVWALTNFRDGAQYWPGYSYPQYEAVRDVLGARASVAFYLYPVENKIGLGESSAKAQVSDANVAFFAMTGVHAELGRLYDSTEDRLANPQPVAVLSDRYWTTALNRDPDVVGKSIVIAGAKYTIIGVARAPFTGVDVNATDIWRPLASTVIHRRVGAPWWTTDNVNGFQILLRPASGVDDAELEQRITVALRRPFFPRPADSTTVAQLGSIVRDAGPGKQGQEVEIAIRLAGVALIVLIIACANVVNLLLARAARRQREIGVRLALGISRSRLLRLLLAESVVVAVVAGGAAILVAWFAGTALRRLLLPDVHWASSPVDWRVIALALGVAIVAGILAGLVPALQSASTDVTHALKAGGGTGVRSSRLRSALVVSQAALSVLLLCGAGLFIRSLSNVQQMDIGFDAARLITATVRWDDPSRSTDPSIPARMPELASRIAAIPGVSHVALTGERPIYQFSLLTFFTATDSLRPGTFDPTFTPVSRGYFVAAGIHLLQGEDFSASAGGPHTVIVNRAMAHAAWPGRAAIGQCMRFGSRVAPCYRVIGVVADSRVRTITEDPAPQYYLSLNDLPGEAKGWTAGYVILSADPAVAGSVISSVRALVRQVYPGGIPAIVRLSDYLEPQYRPWRLGATLFSVFGLLALVVAVVGIYSTTSYGVQQRIREFGVRIALGARLADIMTLVLGDGMRVVLVGVGVGIALALASGRLVASLLYGVRPSDPVTAIGVAALLLVTGILAGLAPALRAARVDPSNALRAE